MFLPAFTTPQPVRKKREVQGSLAGASTTPFPPRPPDMSPFPSSLRRKATVGFASKRSVQKCMAEMAEQAGEPVSNLPPGERHPQKGGSKVPNLTPQLSSGALQLLSCALLSAPCCSASALTALTHIDLISSSVSPQTRPADESQHYLEPAYEHRPVSLLGPQSPHLWHGKPGESCLNQRFSALRASRNEGSLAGKSGDGTLSPKGTIRGNFQNFTCPDPKFGDSDTGLSVF